MPVFKRNNPLIAAFIAEDPVRPGFSWRFRTAPSRAVYSVHWEHSVQGILCVAYCNWIPTNMEELEYASESTGGDILIAYTVWSYGKGAGRLLVREGVKAAIKERPTVKRILTLSPRTDMARDFHLGNGAFWFSSNPLEDNVNFEYPKERIKW